MLETFLVAVDNKTTLSIFKDLQTLSRLGWAIAGSTVVHVSVRNGVGKFFVPIKRFSTISPVVVLYPHKYVRFSQTFSRDLLVFHPENQ